MSNIYYEEFNRLIAAVERLGDIEAEAAKTNERMVALQELLVAKSMELMEQQKRRVPTDEELDDAILSLIRHFTESEKAHPKAEAEPPMLHDEAAKRGGIAPEDIRGAMCKRWNFPGTDTRVAAALQHLSNCGRIKLDMVNLYGNHCRHMWFYVGEGGA